MERAADILDLVSSLKARGEAFVLATVVRTVAATAAKAGAKAVIRPDGSISEGWIGGGCARGAVLKAAGEALADNPASLTEAFARGATTFAEAGGPEAYFGYPRRAGAAEGEASYAVMAEALADAVIDSLGVRS